MDSDAPFERLLAEASEFDLVDGTFVKIGDRYDHWVDASRYTPEERVIMLAWHSSGIIGNGGFEYLFAGEFDGDPDFEITAGTFDTLGLGRCYEAFQEAFRLFPSGRAPHDSEERIRQYMTASETIRKDIDKKFWWGDSDDVLNERLAQFIRADVAKLGNLDAGKATISKSPILGRFRKKRFPWWLRRKGLDS